MRSLCVCAQLAVLRLLTCNSRLAFAVCVDLLRMDLRFGAEDSRQVNPCGLHRFVFAVYKAKETIVMNEPEGHLLSSDADDDCGSSRPRIYR